MEKKMMSKVIIIGGLFVISTASAVEIKHSEFFNSSNCLSGKSQPAITSSKDDGGSGQDKQIDMLIKIPTVASFDILPIVTPNMKPGKISAQKINLVNLDKPIFIVGSDSLSVNWLADHAEKLKQINAIGLLVQADTQLDVARVKKSANGAIILPMSGEVIGEQLGIRSYPVLITKNFVEQ